MTLFERSLFETQKTWIHRIKLWQLKESLPEPSLNGSRGEVVLEKGRSIHATSSNVAILGKLATIFICRGNLFKPFFIKWL